MRELVALAAFYARPMTTGATRLPAGAIRARDSVAV